MPKLMYQGKKINSSLLNGVTFNKKHHVFSVRAPNVRDDDSLINSQVHRVASKS